MATLLSLCQGQSSVVAQGQAIEEQLSAVRTKVQAAFDSLNDDEAKAYTKKLQTAVANHDQLFAGTAAGSLNNALKNAGLSRLDRTKREAEKNLEFFGLTVLQGRMYVCNRQAVSKYFTKTSTESPQILSGLTSETDSKVSTPRARDYVSSKIGQADTCTGMYDNNGTVDQMREMLKGFGGDIAQLKRFIDDTWTTGINVIWSMPTTITVDKPSNVDTFDFDAVRELISFPAYNEDINIVDDVAYVFSEIYVSDSSARSLAEARARDLAYLHGIKGTPALICRLVRCTDHEDVKNGTVTIRTNGFDASKLSPSNYTLGITVNGIKRVIDVTGDKGTNAVFAEYTSKTVASMIKQTFGPHLNVSAYGSEVLMSTAESGPKTSIGFFVTDEFDASDALGISGMVTKSLNSSSRVGSIASNVQMKLSDSSGVTWQGGNTLGSPVSDSLAALVKQYELDDVKAKCVVSGSPYWTAVESESSNIAASLENVCDTAQTDAEWIESARPVIRSLERLYCFTDICDFRVSDAKTLISELGDAGITDILVRRPEIDDIDLVFSEEDTNAAISSLMSSHAESDAVVDSTTSSSVTLINTFRQNKSKVAYVGSLFNFIDANADTIDPVTRADLKGMVCAYASSVLASTTPILQKSQHHSIGKMISNLYDDMQSLLTSFGKNIGSVLIDSNAPAKVVAAIVDFACRQSPDVCDKVGELYDMMSRNKDRLENAASDAEGVIADLVGGTLDAVLGTAFAGMVYAVNLLSRLVEEATKIVNTAKSKVTSFFQTIFNRPNQSLPEILADLANLSYNVYGDMSIKTKFMSCYASGSASASIGAVFNATFEIVNTIIGAICAKVDAVVKALNDALAVIQCIADKLMQTFHGSSSFEMAGAGAYVAMGMVPMPVSFTLQCTMSYGYTMPDPGISRALARLMQDITALGSALKLQTIKFNTLSKSALIYKAMEVTQQTAASAIVEDLRSAIVEKLESLLSC